MKKLLIGLLFTLSVVTGHTQTNSIIKGLASINTDSATFKSYVNTLQYLYGDIGALYYNKQSSKWRIFSDSTWSDLNSGGGGGGGAVNFANNGVSLSGDTVQLGGTLKYDVTINGDTNNFTFDKIPTFFFNTDDTNIYMYLRNQPGETENDEFFLYLGNTFAQLNKKLISFNTANLSYQKQSDIYADSTQLTLKYTASNFGSDISTVQLYDTTAYIYSFNSFGQSEISINPSLINIESTDSIQLSSNGNILIFNNNPTENEAYTTIKNVNATGAPNYTAFKIGSSTTGNGSVFQGILYEVGGGGTGPFSISGAIPTDGIGNGGSISINGGNAGTTSGNSTGGNIALVPGTGNGTGRNGQLEIADGSNQNMGTAVLVGGTVTVNNTLVTANSRIFLTTQTPGGTPGAVYISARVAGTSFTITSTSGTDTSTVAWLIIEPN